MGVKSYIGKNGETLWAASAYARSRAVPGIKIEKERTGFGSQREAQGVCKQLERECEREVLIKEAQGSSWGSVVEAFETYLGSPQAANLHETTRLDYIATIKKHTRSWWKRSAAEITKGDIRELFAQMASQGFSVSHRKKMKIVINRVFLHGMESRMIRGIDESPTYGIQLGREEEVVPEILTLGEIRKLLAEARALPGDKTFKGPFPASRPPLWAPLRVWLRISGLSSDPFLPL